MSNENLNEMEQIQKSLEQFLNQEIGQPKPQHQNKTMESGYEIPGRSQEERKGRDLDDEDLEDDEDFEDDEDLEEEDDFEDVRDVGAKKSGKSHTGFHLPGKRPNSKKKGEQKEKARRKAQKKAEKKAKNRKREEALNMAESTNKAKQKKQDQRDRRNGGRKEEPQKKSGFKKFLAVLLFLLILFGCLWYFTVGGAYDKMQHAPDSALAGEVLKDKGVTNILLIGSDSRSQDEEGRSDAMILLSVSNKTKTIHMTSLLRDMYVEIPGHDGNRLNAAYSFGGPELLLETVKQNLGIEVNRYVVVNFEAFANLVDAVGGVDLELTNEEVQWVNAYLNEYNLLREMPLETDYLDTSLSGVIHLNGPQALAYSRNRYIGSDFGRTERQRKVLSEVFKKLPGAVATNADGIMNGLFPNLTTNLSKLECLTLSMNISKMLSHEFIQSSIPLEGTYKNADIRGMAVLEVDFEANKEYIRKEIYGEN